MCPQLTERGPFLTVICWRLGFTGFSHELTIMLVAGTVLFGEALIWGDSLHTYFPPSPKVVEITREVAPARALKY